MNTLQEMHNHPKRIPPGRDVQEVEFGFLDSDAPEQAPERFKLIVEKGLAAAELGARLRRCADAMDPRGKYDTPATAPDGGS